MVDEVTGYVCIGDVPEFVVGALWPDANVRDRRVWLNVENVRRHLSAKSDGATRLAFYESNLSALTDCLCRVVCFIRYDRVGAGELGLDVIVPGIEPSSPGTYLLIGVRMSEHPMVLNHVATVYRIDEKCLRRLVKRRRAVSFNDDLGDDLDPGC